MANTHNLTEIGNMIGGLNMYSKLVREQIGYFVNWEHCTYYNRLKYCPYGSAGVNNDGHGNITLVSYTTPVCHLTNDGWLTCTGTYSQTTRKHISAFMKEYAPGFGYHTAKECYEQNYMINIYTGEIKTIDNH